jgi:hypothetical protein
MSIDRKGHQVDTLRITWDLSGGGYIACCGDCGRVLHRPRGCNRAGLAYALDATMTAWRDHVEGRKCQKGTKL